MKYKVIALMGKAGSGKDSIMQLVLQSNQCQFNEIISCTTRPPRENEVNGKNYFFLSSMDFRRKVDLHEMLEWTIFNDWYYGTAIDTLSTDKINIGVFNPTGVRYLLAHPDIDATVYYIQASDKDRLIRQLNREVSPNVKEIVRRYSADEIDFSNIDFENIPLENSCSVDLVSNVNRIVNDAKRRE